MYTIEEFDKQKTKIMNYIMYKKRTEKEVRNKFSSTIQEELLYDIIDYIKQAGYLNDNDYIKKAIMEYINLKNLSITEIKYKLSIKGISIQMIEDYIDNNKEELEKYELNSAKNLYQKKIKNSDKQQIKQYLIKKGYKTQTIKEVVKCQTC
ncbi:MAG: hypothetical protein HFJ53_04585 [Clostridia bacterium]|jgi:SOS response regulatory protein OraA/RecX|nr:hypothetical protein [Clostridia bacterium]